MKYSILTEIIRNATDREEWIVKAKIIKNAMFFEAHGQSGNLHQAEQIAIDYAKEIAKIK